MEFDFYENLVTEAIATLAHLSRAVAKLETQAVAARPPTPLGDNPKAKSLQGAEQALHEALSERAKVAVQTCPWRCLVGHSDSESCNDARYT